MFGDRAWEPRNHWTSWGHDSSLPSTYLSERAHAVLCNFLWKDVSEFNPDKTKCEISKPAQNTMTSLYQPRQGLSEHWKHYTYFKWLLTTSVRDKVYSSTKDLSFLQETEQCCNDKQSLTVIKKKKKKIYSCYSRTHYKPSTSLYGRERNPLQQDCHFLAISQGNHPPHIRHLLVYSACRDQQLKNRPKERWVHGGNGGRGPLPGSLKQAQCSDIKVVASWVRHSSTLFLCLTQEVAALITFPYILVLSHSFSTKLIQSHNSFVENWKLLKNKNHYFVMFICSISLTSQNSATHINETVTKWKLGVNDSTSIARLKKNTFIFNLRN